MAVGKEIRTKIDSVKNTQKITRAMEMVAAAKLKKTQTRMLKARPYAENIRDVVGHLMHVNPEYAHTYLVKRPIKRVGLIVFTTDRGLCGGHNVNVFRSVVQQIRAFEKDGIEVDASQGDIILEAIVLGVIVIVVALLYVGKKWIDRKFK